MQIGLHKAGYLLETYRGDVLDVHLFENPEEIRILSDEWMFSYNNEIPHGSLNDLTPNEYARAVNSGKAFGFTTIKSNNSSSNNVNIHISTVLKSRRLQ